jgi:glycosyltransferase involved in cell wall biosynthesis
VLSVGRLHAQKGHATLIEAVAACRDRDVHVDLAVAGEGPLRGELVALARRLGIEDRVQLLGRCEDVRKLLRATDVFAFPSLYEAVGIALLEAMACGVAIVASRVGGIPEIVADGVSGLLVPPGEVVPLAEALIRLAHDPGHRIVLGQAARDRALAFDIQGQVQALEELYEGLV